MDYQTYQKMSLTSLRGRKVRTLLELHNGYVTIAEGTTMTIIGKRGGLELRAEPCTTCGLGAQITKVPPADVELLLELDEPTCHETCCNDPNTSSYNGDCCDL